MAAGLAHMACVSAWPSASYAPRDGALRAPSMHTQPPAQCRGETGWQIKLSGGWRRFWLFFATGRSDDPRQLGLEYPGW